MKLELKENVELLEELDLDQYSEEKLHIEIINFQKNFLRAFNRTLKKAETKKEIIEKIYMFRYYKLIPINQEKIGKQHKKI